MHGRRCEACRLASCECRGCRCRRRRRRRHRRPSTDKPLLRSRPPPPLPTPPPPLLTNPWSTSTSTPSSSTTSPLSTPGRQTNIFLSAGAPSSPQSWSGGPERLHRRLRGYPEKPMYAAAFRFNSQIETTSFVHVSDTQHLAGAMRLADVQDGAVVPERPSDQETKMPRRPRWHAPNRLGIAMVSLATRTRERIKPRAETHIGPSSRVNGCVRVSYTYFASVRVPWLASLG